MLFDFAIEMATIWAKANAGSFAGDPASFASGVMDVAVAVQRRVSLSDEVTLSAGQAAASGPRSELRENPPAPSPHAVQSSPRAEGRVQTSPAGVV